MEPREAKRSPPDSAAPQQKEFSVALDLAEDRGSISIDVRRRLRKKTCVVLYDTIEDTIETDEGTEVEEVEFIVEEDSNVHRLVYSTVEKRWDEIRARLNVKKKKTLAKKNETLAKKKAPRK